MDLYQEIVLLFTRYPEPGLSKTRLIPVLGPEGAADLQRLMTERITAQIADLAARRPLGLEIHYEGGNPDLMRTWLGSAHRYQHQIDGDLGTRMAHAIAAHLHRKTAIVLTGSDCMETTADLLADALDALTRHDLVIGPACDGGYYLIGVRGDLPRNVLHRLFAGIAWGTKAVFADTMTRADHFRLNAYLLPRLHDIDRPEDLGYIHHHPGIE